MNNNLCNVSAPLIQGCTFVRVEQILENRIMLERGHYSAVKLV